MHQIRPFDKSDDFEYSIQMFVSVVLDPSGVESAKALATILARFSFRKVQRACWECASLNEPQLVVLKREMDSVTDYYDKVRLYQFPVSGAFAITELHHKKWRRCVLGAAPAEQRVS